MNTTLSMPYSAGLMRSIETRREQRGITRKELARQIRVSQRTMNASICGHTEISLRLLLRITSALELQVELVPSGAA